MQTIPFFSLIDESSEIWTLVNRDKFPHLYPSVSSEVLTEDMIDTINDHFYYRQIGFSSPERFLRHFQRMIIERAAIWKKAIDTETALTADDMKYNYDLHENSERNIERNYDGRVTNLPNLTTTNTPNLTTETETENALTSHQMDTPDGITTDIDDYLSNAQKDTTSDTTTEKQTGTNTTTQTGSSTTTTDDTNTDEETFEMRRYGNIGVQTSAEIMQKTRDLYLAWDAWGNLIFPELSVLFLNVLDVDEIDLW